jgi:periplasmic protein CpxP/Spy
MFRRTRSVTSIFAATVLLGTIALPGSLVIAAGDSSAANPSTAADTMKSPSAESAAVEARIKVLHDKLHITAAQKTQWDNLTQIMRENAQAMYDLEKQRSNNAGEMTAVDAVKSYQQVIQAHEAGMAKFVPAFEALYDSLSPSQKKIADAMFRSRVRAEAQKRAG